METVTSLKKNYYEGSPSIGFMGALPNPIKLPSARGSLMESLRELKDDPHVWSCVQSRKSGALSAEWEIVGLHAEEITKALEKIDMTAFFRDALEALLFGYQPIEIIWEKSGDGIYPAKLLAKPQEWFAFDAGREPVFLSRANPSGEKIIPHKMIFARYEPSWRNPYGESLLAKCWLPAKFKRGATKFWATFTEKYGMPILTANFKRGATQAEIETLAESLAKMAQDDVFVSPEDIEIELKEPQRGSSSELYSELIKHANAEISKAILSQTLTTELDAGSYAAAQTHFKIRREVVEADCKLLEGVATELLRSIAALNFLGKDGAKLKFSLKKE